MKKRQKQLPSSKKKRLESSSDGEESDVERNFALITERKGTEEEEQCYKIGEEKTGEDEERSDSSDEMESDNGEEQEGDEEDGNSEEDDDDDDPEDAGGSNEVQTKKDIRKGECVCSSRIYNFDAKLVKHDLQVTSVIFKVGITLVAGQLVKHGWCNYNYTLPLSADVRPVCVVGHKSFFGNMNVVCMGDIILSG